MVFSFGLDCEVAFVLHHFGCLQNSLFAWADICSIEVLNDVFREPGLIFSKRVSLGYKNMFRCCATGMAHGRSIFENEANKTLKNPLIYDSFLETKQRVAYLSAKLAQQLAAPSACAVMKVSSDIFATLGKPLSFFIDRFHANITRSNHSELRLLIVSDAPDTRSVFLLHLGIQ